jgi:hypothetical protein
MYPQGDFNFIPYEIHVETSINKIIEENTFIISFDIGICLILGLGLYWLLKKFIFKK